MTLRSILVPLDGSAFAEQALPAAAAIADRVGAHIRLALVHQSPSLPRTPEATEIYTNIELAVHRAEQKYLERIAERLGRESNVEVSSLVLKGAPGPALEQHIADMGLSLVVMSTHGRGGIERAWLGSVADYLMRSLTVPVLLIRSRDDAAANEQVLALTSDTKILVPLDGSTEAATILEPAAVLARKFGAELSLVSVIVPHPMPLDVLAPAQPGHGERLIEVQRAEAKEYLQGLADKLRADDLRVSYETVLGSGVAEALLELARAQEVGLVALATHGRGGLARLMMGSVADKLVRAAERPVLVYRPRS